MYKDMKECPDPYVGLEWTELFSYYGKVVAEIKRSFCFQWQEEDDEWKKSLNEIYYVIEDTVAKEPYFLTKQQFKNKFSYGDGVEGCWVRFKTE